jgi:dihydroorotase
VPADITILDLRALRTVDPCSFKSLARNTPFAGMRLKGWPVATIVGGNIVWQAG